MVDDLDEGTELLIIDLLGNPLPNLESRAIFALLPELPSRTVLVVMDRTLAPQIYEPRLHRHSLIDVSRHELRDAHEPMISHFLDRLDTDFLRDQSRNVEAEVIALTLHQVEEQRDFMHMFEPKNRHDRRAAKHRKKIPEKSLLKSSRKR